MISYDSSQVNITGGNIGSDLYAYSESQITISGGKIGGGISAGIDNNCHSLIVFEGSNFAINGQNVGYGDSARSYASTGTLTGTLDSGDLLNNMFVIHGNSDIIFIPEPITISLLLIGSVGFLRKRK